MSPNGSVRCSLNSRASSSLEDQLPVQTTPNKDGRTHKGKTDNVKRVVATLTRGLVQVCSWVGIAFARKATFEMLPVAALACLAGLSC